MAKTVVGYFDRFDQAERAVSDLTKRGFRREDISIVANKEARSRTTTVTGDDDTDAAEGAAVGATTGAVVGGAAGLIASLAGLTIPVIGPVLAAGPLVATLAGAGVGAVAGGLIGALVSAGVPEEEARLYEEGVKRGGTLVTLKADDARANEAVQIMNQHGAADVRRRAAEGWRTEGTTAAASTTRTQSAAATPQRGEQARVPVIEEDIKIGKRQVEQGGVRVESKVTEQPVREQVKLHEERVNVQRRPTDRPASDADFATHRGETIEVRETREEPVVQKEARVVEEVVVTKEARDRTQTIEDTVRRKDVEIRDIGGQKGDYSAYEGDWKQNYQSAFAPSGMTYEQCAPAYRYGAELASDNRYRGRDWSTVESDARRDWEGRSPGTWDRMKDAVKYSWNRAKEKVS